jgi:Type VI secretion system effector, Hcp
MFKAALTLVVLIAAASPALAGGIIIVGGRPNIIPHVTVTTPTTTLRTGSQSTGAGAGKVTLHPFSNTKKIDKASPLFY